MILWSVSVVNFFCTNAHSDRRGGRRSDSVELMIGPDARDWEIFFLSRFLEFLTNWLKSTHYSRPLSSPSRFFLLEYSKMLGDSLRLVNNSVSQVTESNLFMHWTLLMQTRFQIGMISIAIWNRIWHCIRRQHGWFILFCLLLGVDPIVKSVGWFGPESLNGSPDFWDVRQKWARIVLASALRASSGESKDSRGPLRLEVRRKESNSIRNSDCSSKGRSQKTFTGRKRFRSSIPEKCQCNRRSGNSRER
jgi:hypothetical protein